MQSPRRDLSAQTIRRQTVKEPITSYIGLDIHKESIAMAIAEANRAAPRFIGTINPIPAELCKALRRVCTKETTLIVYEAGPCGYGWVRYLRKQGWACDVIAPSAHSRALMAYLGLVPSEFSSGNSRRLGEITKSGNKHARRILVEAAWCNRFKAQVTRCLEVRQEGQPKIIRDISWKAQLRLSKRWRSLSMGRTPRTKSASPSLASSPALSGMWRAK
jgi:transposase